MSAPHPLQQTKRATIPLPPTASKDLLLLILLCDTPVPSVKEKYGTYHSIFSTLFSASAAAISKEHAVATGRDPNDLPLGHELIVESYDVTHGVYPDEERCREADGVLITGSASSAHDTSLTWLPPLFSFLRFQLPSLLPETAPIIGICFGHQVLAVAYGSAPLPESNREVETAADSVAWDQTICAKNPAGWEIGTRRVQLSAEGKELFGGKELAIHQMHADHVPSSRLPPGFSNLGSTSDCAVHGMLLKRDSSRPAQKGNVRVVSMQGHPEFTADIVNRVIAIREEKGVFSHELAAKSKEHAAEVDEGVRIGDVLLSLMGARGDSTIWRGQRGGMAGRGRRS